MCCWKRGFSVRVKSPPMMGTWSRRCPLGYGAGVSFPRGYPLEVMWGLTFTMFGSSDCKLMKVYRLIAIRPTGRWAAALRGLLFLVEVSVQMGPLSGKQLSSIWTIWLMRPLIWPPALLGWRNDKTFIKIWEDIIKRVSFTRSLYIHGGNAHPL